MSDYVLCTNGTKTKKGVKAKVFDHKLRDVVSVNLVSLAIVFLTEKIAIKLGARELNNFLPANKTIVALG